MSLYDVDQVNEAIREALAEAAPRWIPVGERLPEPRPADDPEGEVVILLDDGRRLVARYGSATPPLWPGTKEEVAGLWTYASGGAESGYLFQPGPVTHWMPLPAAPEKG